MSSRNPATASLGRGEARCSRRVAKRSTRPLKGEIGLAQSENGVASVEGLDNIRVERDGASVASIGSLSPISLGDSASPKTVENAVNIRYVKGDLTCPLCGVGGQTASWLLRHFSLTHPASTPYFRCTKCPFVQRNVQSVAAHMRHCTGPDERGAVINKRQARVASGDVPCGFCERTFRSLQGRGQHVRTAHPTEYHETLKAPSERGAGWTDLELKVMASREASQRLAGVVRTRVSDLRDAVPHRTIQAVYAVRKKSQYKALLESEVERQRRLPSTTEAEMEDDPVGANGRSGAESIMPRERLSSDDPGSIPLREALQGETSNDTGPIPLRVPSERLTSDDPRRNVVREALEGVSSNDPGSILVKTDALVDLNPNDPRRNVVKEALCEFLNSGSYPNNALMKRVRQFVAGSLEGRQDRFFTELWNFWRTVVPEPKEKRTPRNRGRRPPTQFGRRRRERPREREFKATQEALRRRRKTTVDQMLEGTYDPNEEEQLPSREAVESFYREKLERTTPPPATGMAASTVQSCQNVTNRPLTPTEVQAALTGMKANSAPGPDGWQTKAVLQKVPAEGLCAVLNVFLLLRWLPRELRDSRSILIPKQAGARGNLNEYRPLSITPCLSRLYARVVSRRLQDQVPFHVRQKAFVDEDGCFANIHLLRTVLKEARRQRKEVGLCLLDLSKAFDSVPHWAVEGALRAKGFDDDTVAVVRSFYEGAITRFYVSAGETDQATPIRILNGVRQGCPLSPYLFNTVLDHALQEINGDDSRGVRIGSSRVTAAAFADDLVIFGNSRFELQNTIDRVFALLTAAGLSFNAKKSMTVRLTPVRGKKIMKVISKPEFHVGDDTIPCARVSESVRYLGLDISPAGASIRDRLGKLTSWLRNVQKYRLKPEQRVEIVRSTVLGKLAYSLRNSNVNRQILEQMDRAIRGYMKKVLHLPPGTPNAWFYMNTRQGGLGLRQLRLSIPTERARALEGLSDLDDGVMHEVRSASQKELEALIRMAHGETRGARQARLKGEFLRTEWGKYAGAMTASEASYAPIFGGHAEVGGHKLVRLAQFLSGNLPTRSALHRGHTLTDQLSVRCRKCGLWCETEAHVLSGCGQMKDAYVRRHDRLVEILAQGLSSGRREVFPEMEYQLRGERFRPDVTCVTADRVDVVEVSVPFAHSPCYLEERGRQKEEKYIRPSFLEAVGRRFPGRSISVRSVVIGCRGEIPSRTKCSLTDLGIWHLRNRFQRSALFGSLWVFDVFRSQAGEYG